MLNCFQLCLYVLQLLVLPFDGRVTDPMMPHIQRTELRIPIGFEGRKRLN